MTPGLLEQAGVWVPVSFQPPCTVWVGWMEAVNLAGRVPRFRWGRWAKSRENGGNYGNQGEKERESISLRWAVGRKWNGKEGRRRERVEENDRELRLNESVTKTGRTEEDQRKDGKKREIEGEKSKRQCCALEKTRVCVFYHALCSEVSVRCVCVCVITPSKIIYLSVSPSIHYSHSLSPSFFFFFFFYLDLDIHYKVSHGAQIKEQIPTISERNFVIDH